MKLGPGFLWLNCRSMFHNRTITRMFICYICDRQNTSNGDGAVIKVTLSLTKPRMFWKFLSLQWWSARSRPCSRILCQGSLDLLWTWHFSFPTAKSKCFRDRLKTPANFHINRQANFFTSNHQTFKVYLRAILVIRWINHDIVLGELST